MPQAPAGHFLGTEYNDFLFARIGEDSNGMFLSVLSALVRLDLDPWEEAATLARLPFETAVKRLATLILALPDQLSARRDSGTIAVRVIALLPAGRPSLTVGAKAAGGGLDPKLLWTGLLAVTAAIMLIQVCASSRMTDPGSAAPAVTPLKSPTSSGCQK